MTQDEDPGGTEVMRTGWPFWWRFVAVVGLVAAAGAVVGALVEHLIERAFQPQGIARDIVVTLPLALTLIAIYLSRGWRFRVAAGVPLETRPSPPATSDRG